MSEPKKKTPSVKVIAAYMLREVLTNGRNNFTPEEVSSLVDSRVNEKKFDKVRGQYDKIADKFRQRVETIINKHEAPPAPKAKKGPPPRKGKK